MSTFFILDRNEKSIGVVDATTRAQALTYVRKILRTSKAGPGSDSTSDDTDTEGDEDWVVAKL